MMTKPGGWNCRILIHPWQKQPAVHIWRSDLDRSVTILKPVEFERYAPDHFFGAHEPKPTIGRWPDDWSAFPGGNDTREIIQAIVDAAHEAGFRPTETQEPFDKQLQSVQRHLEDMRALVANTHGPLPGLPFTQPPTFVTTKPQD